LGWDRGDEEEEEEEERLVLLDYGLSRTTANCHVMKREIGARRNYQPPDATLHSFSPNLQLLKGSLSMEQGENEENEERQVESDDLGVFKSCDVWCLGIVALILLVGESPIKGVLSEERRWEAWKNGRNSLIEWCLEHHLKDTTIIGFQ